MKFRPLTCALALAAGLSAGAAMAQTAPSTSPSNTPNDTTAAPPNRPLPAGQMAPAPNQTHPAGTTPSHMNKSGTMSTDKHSGQMPNNKKPEANDNVPRTPASGATPPPGYPNTGGSK